MGMLTKMLIKMAILLDIQAMASSNDSGSSRSHMAQKNCSVVESKDDTSLTWNYNITI